MPLSWPWSWPLTDNLWKMAWPLTAVARVTREKAFIVTVDLVFVLEEVEEW